MISLRLLLLEDSELDARLLLREISGMGQSFDTKVVYKKDEFEAAVLHWKPDLIISDYNLQTFTGEDALIFSKKAMPEIPFILLSGSVTKEMEVSLLKNRASDVVRKDSLKKIPFVIRRVLNEKEDKQILQKALNELGENLKFQEALAEISLNFNSQKKFGEKVAQTLAILGEITNVSRVYVFEDFEKGMKTKNTYEWCNKGVEPQIEKLQDFSYQENIPSWKSHLLNKGNVFCNFIEELPLDLQVTLKAQDIKSVLVYPIVMKGDLFGFIGFDEIRETRFWTKSEDKLLKSISGLVSNAFSEELAKKELQNSNDQLTRLLIEKEALVGEVHHRVKNNLALVSSFLQLDQMGIGNLKTTDEIISANLLRIKSIAIIHELVYQDGTFTNINVLKTLEQVLISSFSEKRKKKLTLNIDPDSQDVFFNINQAVPFSLMISEIMFQVFSITGEYEYLAEEDLFVKIEEKKGNIRVILKGENLVKLLHKLQEGEELDFSNLVDVLSSQLEVTLTIESDQHLARFEFFKKNSKGSSTTLTGEI